MTAPRLTLPAVSVLDLNKWMCDHDELPRCVTVAAAEAAAQADFDWLVANHDVVYVSEAWGPDRLREHTFNPPARARVVGGDVLDDVVSMVGCEVQLIVAVVIEGREGQFLVNLGRRRAYDVYAGMHLDDWREEVVRHPSREAAEAAADEDARALVGREVYIKTVDVLGGTHTFDAPVRVRVTNCVTHPTDDGQWNYADFYVDFAFCDQAHAEVARGAWAYGRQHAYPRAPSAYRELLPKRPDADRR